MRNIAIITARSGSKGLKDKNIKILNGKPLLAYSIEAAKKTNLFDEIMVSTDSNKYAEIARKFGANVPFLRSKSLSSDTTSSWDVIKNVLTEYRSMGNDFDTVALLQPTSPLRSYKDIIRGYEILEKNSASLVASVCKTDHSPLWTNTLPENNSINNFINPEIYSLPRQKIPTYYRINGAIYIIKLEHLFLNEYLYSNKSYALIMDKSSSIDIDDELDFSIAEILMKKKKY